MNFAYVTATDDGGGCDVGGVPRPHVNRQPQCEDATAAEEVAAAEKPPKSIALLIANFSPAAWGDDDRHHLVLALEISGCANAVGLFIIMSV
ncbi:hypothetical protein ACLKA6_004805 [Drosophila palustris]